jgi:hypothetical protein
MAQQTKRASKRSSSTASSKRSASSNGRSGSRAKPQSRGSRSTATSVAKKLETPGIAGAAALGGLAGGFALARWRPRRKATSKNLAEAARKIGGFGAQAGELAAELRMVREAAAQDHHRSPIEVVLQGLTSRRK